MIPYRTDAPLYHLPIVTVALILLNTVAFFQFAMGNLFVRQGWLLEYGSGIHPQQWLLSRFMHGGFGHLIGNMIFLWIFGMVIEGKLGWWRFLICYLSLAIGQAALEQMLMASSTSGAVGSLGASAAIYGLMAMACVWAPMNEVSFLFFFFFHRYITFDVSIGVLAAFYVGIDLTLWIFLGSVAGSSILHLMGAALGGLLGVVMLKRKLVDCENWDLFSVWRGEYGPDAKENELAPTPGQVATHEENRAMEAKRKFVAYLKIKQAPKALDLLHKMADLDIPLKLSREELLGLIVGLHHNAQWKDSAPLMAEFLEKFPDQSEAVRLKLAQICLVELERPSKALELLEPLIHGKLSAENKKLRRKLLALAQKQIADGALEFEEESW